MQLFMWQYVNGEKKVMSHENDRQLIKSFDNLCDTRTPLLLLVLWLRLFRW